MSMRTSKLRDAILLSILAGTAAGGSAFAQEQTSPPSSSELDRITVTGTRIQSQAVTASSPVAEVQGEEFQYTGATRAEDLVNQYPQLTPSFDSMENNGAVGYATVSLRDMGPSRTLTLVNGHRLPPGTVSEWRDISIIPSALIRRVDLLSGGASAVYGSDAVAGVANFILDTDFEGISLNTGWSAYRHKNRNSYIQGLMDARGFDYPNGDSGFDGISRNIDFALGTRFGAEERGHAMAWVTWRKNDALYHGQRDYSSCALNDAATACGGSATNAAGNFYFFQGDFDVGTGARLNPDGSWAEGYGAPYNYAPPNYFQRPDDRTTFGTSIKYAVNDAFEPYLEAMLVDRITWTQIAESGAFFSRIPGMLPCDTPFLGSACADLGLDPADPVGVYVAKRNVEGGPRSYRDQNVAYRAIVGARGALGQSWDYNVSFLNSENATTTHGYNDFLSDRIIDGLLGCPTGSFSGCLPYNVWVPGGVTPEAAAALAGESRVRARTSMKVWNGYVSGDLNMIALPWADGEGLKAVFGLETRTETYQRWADENSQAGNFAGAGGPTTEFPKSEISVDEFFTEFALPLFRGDGAFKALDLDAGYRRSQYNLYGNANTYKVGMAADFGMARIRGGYNRAIRAPNMGETFSQQQLALFNGPDPCAGANPRFTQAQCANTGVSADRYGQIALSPANQYNQFIGGKLEGLTPEIADTYTFGVVFTPNSNLALTADYYDIKLTDRIGTIGAVNILEYCALTGNPLLCDKIHRSAAGDLWRGSDLDSSGYVENLTSNFGDLRFRGVDLGVNYRFDMLGGRTNVSFQGTRVLEQQIAPLPGVNDDATYDCAGKINPSCQTAKWRHVASARWNNEAFNFGLRWRYFGSLDYVSNDGEPMTTDSLVAPKGGIGAQSYFDVSGGWQITPNIEWTLGVNNIADKAPPLVGGTLANNANTPGGYDQLGRYVFTSINLRY